MKLGIHEILSKVNDLPTYREKEEFLIANQSPALLRVLIYAYHPSIKWNLGKGRVEYTPCNIVDAEGRLYAEARRLYLFADGEEGLSSDLVRTQETLSATPKGQHKRQMLFIQLLESIDPNDAKLLIAMREKGLPFKGINRQVVREAFPGLLGEDTSAPTAATAKDHGRGQSTPGQELDVTTARD